MEINFEVEETPSTASRLFIAKAIKNGEVVMQWHIACDDESQLLNIAAEAYNLAMNPPTLAQPISQNEQE